MTTSSPPKTNLVLEEEERTPEAGVEEVVAARSDFSFLK
jgi:hypothetical protein